jgi:hypothetical protein
MDENNRCRGLLAMDGGEWQRKRVVRYWWQRKNLDTDG